MCLTVNSKNRIRIASKDIKVWKVFEFKENELYSPYRYHTYSLGKKHSICMNLEILDETAVHKGIHSFLSKSDILKYYKWLHLDETVIIPCIIPKGSEYIRGKFELCPSIVSDNIILPEEFTYNNWRYSLDEKGMMVKKHVM